MNDQARQRLLDRLDAIGQSVARTDHALALLGLGSAGVELERMDAYSDLDFFLIVQPGFKATYIADLGWISAVAPVAYHFQNTLDGYKLLFDDGIFCEFAVFEPQELTNIPFVEGRVVWKADGVPATVAQPARSPVASQQRTAEWMVGEAITCLYVGLKRLNRGETLSAQRFIQQYAVERVLELAPLIATPAQGNADFFAPERRFEQRFPQIAAHLGAWVQGYQRNRESALAILDFLEQHVAVDARMRSEIRTLCTE